MDVTSKISDINNALDELKKSQRQIWRRLGGDVYRSSPDQPIKQLENLEQNVYRLEKQFNRHLNSLEETRRLFSELIKQVDTISCVVEKLQKSVKSEYITSNIDFFGHESDNHNGRATPVRTNFLDEHNEFRTNCENNRKKCNETTIASDNILDEENCPSSDDLKTQSAVCFTTKKSQALLFDCDENRTVDNHDKNENIFLKSNDVSDSCRVSDGHLLNSETIVKSSNDDANNDSTPNHASTTEESYTSKSKQNKNITDDMAPIALDSSHLPSPAVDRLENGSRQAESESIEHHCTNKTEHRKIRKHKESKSKGPSHKGRRCKNDFGYKQKRSEMLSDNRVAYHCKGKCFEGIATYPADPQPVQSPPQQNIEPRRKPKQRKAGMTTTQKFNQFHDMEKEEVLDYNPAVGKPRNIKEWLSYAEQLRVNSLIRIRSGAIRHGRKGHDSTLVLNCSENMRGPKFNTMVAAAKEYVNGIKEVHRTRLLEDNIALAIFGGKSGLILESTSDYDLILRHIDGLQPEGEAPVIGGLLMGLAGVLGGTHSQILDNDVPGHMIVFTDESSAEVPVDLNADFSPSNYTRHFVKDAEIGGVITQIASGSIKVYYVPIGGKSNSIMEMAVKETNGKFIDTSEMYRLIRMTGVLVTSAEIASEIRHTQPNPTREFIRQIVMHRTPQANVNPEDWIDHVLEFINPLATEMRRGLFKELTHNSLHLGSRVRRGPDWMFGNQDSELAGTIVGRDNDYGILVEWDSGIIGTYFYDEMTGIKTIIPVQERRILTGEMIAVGCRVMRGFNWAFGDDDGGPGSFGTVLAVRQNSTVVVRWDSRKIGNYNIGHNGLIEVQVCENISEPMNQQSIDNSSYNKTPNYTEIPTEKLSLDTTTNMDDDECPEIYQKYVIPIDPKTQVNAEWEYEEEGRWEQFSSELNYRIEKAYLRKKSGRTILQMETGTFVVYFEKMVMENPKTKDIFSVRRSV